MFHESLNLFLWKFKKKNGNRGTIVGEIYRVPNTSEITLINRYENITKKLSDMPQNVIIGTDQNFDYLTVNSHKNTQDLLCTFLNNGLVPTITMPTRIATTGNTNKTVRTLIDNIYIYPVSIISFLNQVSYMLISLTICQSSCL